MSKLFNNIFPSFGVKNIAVYYWVKIFSLAFFIIANWLFFVLEFISPAQMGILESVSFGIGMLLEIPSGAIADLLGKKITVQIGLLMQTVGIGSFMLTPISTWFIIFGNIISVAGFAMISGSFEALAYDSMVETKTEKYYDLVAARTGSIFPAVTIGSALIGGFLWRYNIYLPWLATTIFMLIALILSFQFTEPTVDTFKFSWQQFIKQNKTGLRELLHPEIKKYLPVLIAILASFYMWSTGIVRIFMGEQFSYNGETLSYLVSGVMIVSSISIFYLDKIKMLLGDNKGIILLTVLGSFGWLLAGFFSESLIIGAIIFLLLIVTGELSEPWRSTIINKHIDSKYRSTVISTLQFFIQLPYVLVAMFFGFMIERQLVQSFYFLVGVVMLVAVFFSIQYKVRNKLSAKFLNN
ncbi:MAG: hypothetical protein H6772_04305 [Pseudomonadales bacterium]|nr:hypothetical protein [Pseudomonadales bacterium]